MSVSDKLSKLIKKTAQDINRKYLGRIIRIEKSMGINKEKYEPKIVIRYKKKLQKAVLVPISINKITEIEDEFVVIDMTFESFIEEVLKIRAIKLEQETQKKAGRIRTATWFGNFSIYTDRKEKNRRKK